jgi:hypothetical protein
MENESKQTTTSTNEGGIDTTNAGGVNTNNAGGMNNETNTNDALFQKLDEILEKRSNGIVKNILKENGLDDSDIKDVLASYTESKKSKKDAVETELATLRQTNAELNNKLKASEKNALVAKQAKELGIAESNLKFVTKLADFSNIEKDGKYDEEAIKSALETVINEVPAFKTESKTETDSGFVKVGGQKSEQTKDDIATNQLRKLMGLPELKK